MKKILITLLCFGIYFIAQAQDNKPFAAATPTMPEKGSAVYISADNKKEERILPHMIDRVERWGYWHAVNTKDLSDFTIELEVKEKGGGVKGTVVLKTKDGVEIKRSKNIKAHSDPSNGMSAWRGFSIGIGRWLKGEVK